MAKLAFRKNPNVLRAVTKIVLVTIGLYVGNQVLTAVGTSIGNHSGTPFDSGFDFLGLDDAGAWSASAIVGVVGLVAAASVIMEFVEIR